MRSIPIRSALGAPANLTDAERQKRVVGELYNTITNGIRTMPRYDKQISVIDRWAIAAYVKALQLSQHADVDSLPEKDKQEILKQLGSAGSGPSAH